MPASIASPATSRIHVQQVRGTSRLVACRSEAPLRLLAPSPSPTSVCVVQSSYGGGMVQGDDIRLEVRCDEDTRLCLTTQANGRVYRNDAGLPTRQVIHGAVAAGAVCIVVPDPMVFHAGSRFEQHQHWTLAEDATLILLDWIQSGRSDSGEAFEFDRVESSVDIVRGGIPLLADRFRCEPARGDPRTAARFGPMNLMLNIYLVGPAAEALRERLVPLIHNPESQAIRELPESGPTHVPARLAGLSTVEEHCSILRALARTREDLDPILQPLYAALAAPELAGFNPR